MLAVVKNKPAGTNPSRISKRPGKNVERTIPYNVGRNVQEIQAFLPPEPGLRAHLFRVAALAARAAECEGLDDRHIEAVVYAALLHHSDSSLGMEGASRLLHDLGLPPVAEFEGVPETIASLIARLDKAQYALVESANLFDEQIENMPYEKRPVQEALHELLASGLVSKPFLRAIEGLRVVTREDLSAAILKLPVFPKAAIEALRASRDPDAGIREIEIAVSRDPVLAGETIQMANSGLFGRAQQVGTLSLALARVGTVAAAHMIATAALKRCFASATLHQIWQHSYDTGGNTVVVASEAKEVDGSDAFLGGLLHDVGRLTFELTPAADAIRVWQEAGFPLTYAELLVTGTDHAEIGAEVLAYWRVPERFIEAVRFHHQPEMTQSALASAIYAAEDVSETLPSIARDHAAVRRLELAAFPRAQSAG